MCSPGGRRGEEGWVGSWGLADANYYTENGEWINNKVLVCSTGNYIQYPGINHNGKEYLKKKVCMYKIESLCYTAETVTTL